MSLRLSPLHQPVFRVRQSALLLDHFDVFADGVFVATIDDSGRDETILTADSLALNALPPGFRRWDDSFPNLRACLDFLGVERFVEARRARPIPGERP